MIAQTLVFSQRARYFSCNLVSRGNTRHSWGKYLTNCHSLSRWGCEFGPAIVYYNNNTVYRISWLMFRYDVSNSIDTWLKLTPISPYEKTVLLLKWQGNCNI